MTTSAEVDFGARLHGTAQDQSNLRTDSQTRKDVSVADRSGWKSFLKRARSHDITKSQTNGVLHALCTVLENAENIERAAVCNTEMIHSATNLSDLGWGCGYRNIQMILSSLASQEPEVFDSVFGPADGIGIIEIQMAIEKSWARGFDIEGAQQLSWKLRKTKKWIGTTEAYALLTNAGYDVCIVQFDGYKNGHTLIDFCASYFGIHEPVSASRRVSRSDKHPLYFQHQGHSRTIVGCVQTKHGIELLVFDPARRIASEIKKLVPGSHARSGLATKSFGHNMKSPRGPKWSSIITPYIVKATALTKKEYQVLRIDGRLADLAKEQRKIIRPCTIR